MSGLEMKRGPHRGVGEAAQGEAGNRSGRGDPKTTLENPHGGLSPRGNPGDTWHGSRENDGRTGWEEDKGLKTGTGIYSDGKQSHAYPDTPLKDGLMVISLQP